MSSQRDGVNPLRPYYIPPSIGEPCEPLPAPNATPFPRGGNAPGNYASKARDMFSDLDYKDYLSEPSPSVVKTVKDLIDELLWKYTSVLMAQPFEVAKTILQVRSQDDVGALGLLPTEESRPRSSTSRNALYNQYPDSDSDADEPAYFTSNLPSTPTPSYPRPPKRTPSSPLEYPLPSKPSLAPHQLNIRRPDSVFEVISQVWQKEGAWGVWKGSNATFIYTILQSLMENWSRSLLSALFNVPDIGLSEDLDRVIGVASPYPWASIFVAGAAAVATGLILSPLDIIRTRLVITSTSRKPRRMVSALRALPSAIIPPALIIPTILHSLVHPILTLSAPLILRTRFMIDRELSPMTFSVAKFCSSSVALFVKLPLETVLRRGQVAVLSSPPYVRALDAASAGPAKPRSRVADEKAPVPVLETIVPPGSYNGMLGTMYTIVSEEGSRVVTSSAAAAAKGKAAAKKGKPKAVETVYRRGQGLEGLWRGWKVSWWGLVGLWTAGVVGGGGDGEF